MWKLILLGILPICLIGAEGQEELEKLEELIAYHDERYWTDNAPEISDVAYDALVKKHADLSKRLSMGRDESPEVKSSPSLDPAEYRHAEAMLSLKKAYLKEEVDDFLEKVLSYSSTTDPYLWLEPKVDGMAVSLIYKSGGLINIVTRGNGRSGKSLIGRIDCFVSIPKVLNGEIENKFLEIRGEAYIAQSEFKKLNKERVESGESAYVSERHAVVGVLSGDSIGRAKVSIVCFDLGGIEGIGFESLSEFKDQLKRWGFSTPTDSIRLQGSSNVWKTIQGLSPRNKDYDYPTDGLVLKVDSFSVQKEMGSGTVSPNWAIAVKFQNEFVETELLQIDLQIGRTGRVTPVGILQPVDIDGRQISRIHLHHEEFIRVNGLVPGSNLQVELRGGTIPQFVRTTSPEPKINFDLKQLAEGSGLKIHKPNGSKHWYISQPDNREWQLVRMEHFLKTMGVFGIGLESLRASLISIQKLDLARLFLPSVQSRLTDHGAKGLERLRGLEVKDLEKLLFGLSIPGFGQRTSEKLANKIAAIEDLLEFKNLRFDPKFGLSRRQWYSLQQYLDQPERSMELSALGNYVRTSRVD